MIHVMTNVLEQRDGNNNDLFGVCKRNLYFEHEIVHFYFS